VDAGTKKLLPVSSSLADVAPLSYCSIKIVHVCSIEVKQLTQSESQFRDDHAPDLAGVDVLTVLQALSDPVRLAIVRQLGGCTGEVGLTCGQIELPVAKSTASHHLKTLHRAGITTEREQGVCKYIRLRRDELDERFPGLLDSVLSAPAAPSA
jgi:DNA-binding transcriptional ArsR family regulator